MESEPVSFVLSMLLRITAVHHSGVKYFSFNEWNTCLFDRYSVKHLYSITIYIYKKECNLTNILRKRKSTKTELNLCDLPKHMRLTFIDGTENLLDVIQSTEIT